jgi:hypothetical protein
VLKIKRAHRLKDFRKKRRGGVRVHVDSLHLFILRTGHNCPAFGMNAVGNPMQVLIA